MALIFTVKSFHSRLVIVVLIKNKHVFKVVFQETLLSHFPKEDKYGKQTSKVFLRQKKIVCIFKLKSGFLLQNL